MRSARSYDTLFSETKLTIMFAPGCPSIDELLGFLRETDYNSISYSQTPPTPSTPGDVVEAPHICTSKFLKGTLVGGNPIVSFGRPDSLKKDLKSFLEEVGDLRLWQAYVGWERIIL
jgi:hypothetical protein